MPYIKKMNCSIIYHDTSTEWYKTKKNDENNSFLNWTALKKQNRALIYRNSPNR